MICIVIEGCQNQRILKMLNEFYPKIYQIFPVHGISELFPFVSDHICFSFDRNSRDSSVCDGKNSRLSHEAYLLNHSNRIDRYQRDEVPKELRGLDRIDAGNGKANTFGKSSVIRQIECISAIRCTYMQFGVEKSVFEKKNFTIGNNSTQRDHNKGCSESHIIEGPRMTFRR